MIEGEMVTASKHRRYTFEEYLRLEAYSNVKHEFLDGQIYAMAGGTPEHAAIAMKVAALLYPQLAGRRCRVYSSDARVRVAQTGLDTYPDLSVVGGQEQRDPEDRNALANPTVLVEVLSPSTAEYDRGEKLEHYKLIPSLQEVVLVAHDQPKIEVCRRDGASWALHSASAGESIEVSSFSCKLDVDEVFRNPLAQ